MRRTSLFFSIVILGLSISHAAAQTSADPEAGKEPSAHAQPSADAQSSAPTEPSAHEQPFAQEMPSQLESATTSSNPYNTVQWLSQLQRVISSANFQVTFVQTIAGKETVPYLWRHGILEDGTEVEQLSLQNGPGRELIRINDVVSVFEPDVQPYSLHSNHINGPIPSALVYHPEELLEAYEFVPVGRARVAGRPAQQIRIVSRDNTRFGYQLWLDEESGMLLKLNMLDLQGTLLEQIQVTAFAINPEPSDYFSRINPSSLPKPMAMGTSQTREHSWDIGYMPAGMREIKQDTRRLALTGQVVEYKLLSDGLVDVSVYVQPAEDALGGDLALRNELSTFLTLTDGKAQVTIVGEIPLQTAKAIATSLGPKTVN